MKEIFFIAAVFLILLLAAMPQEHVSMSQPAAQESQTKEDYYYSAQSAARWHEMNKMGMPRLMRINKVNGIAYTERVPHGARPTCKVTDAVLVASGVEGDGLTVEYTNIAW